ncbi:MAG: CapA family protein, partial [Clostridia bacterium]|nr:CapA family protein [Clostridia bacterium]
MRRLFLYLLIACLLLPACPALTEQSAAEAPVDTVEIYEAPKQIVISFLGDCTLGNTPIERLRGESSFEYFIQENGMEYPFANVLDILRNDDLTVANLEGVFYNYEANKANKVYNFRSSTDHAQILPLASIEAVSIGNNHILDYGANGQQSTLEALEAQGTNWFGTNEYADGTYIFEKDGVKIGFVAAYVSYMATAEHSNKIKDDIAQLKEDGCKVIIACMHGGVEYDRLHDSNQERLADRLIKFGAHIVIGHHPHTIQGIRVEKGRTTLYSIGNFVFGGNSQVRTMDTFIAQITL